jgi:hypothetical protein
MRDWYWKNVFSNREGERVMVGERLTMTDASSRGFERVAVGSVGAQRVLLEAPTSVASERTARRADRWGSISSPFWEGCPADAHPDVPLARLNCISGRTVRQNTVQACTLGSQFTSSVVCDQGLTPCRDINAQDWLQQKNSLFSRK